MITYIVIGLNEEKTIENTIQSIQRIMLSYPKRYEIIYVDSLSSDNTLEIVKKYKDVKIILSKSHHPSAALSRFIGSKYANGEFIFFLDGDMEIDSASNLEYCLDILKDSHVGVISGKMPEKKYLQGKDFTLVTDRFSVQNDLEELRSAGGFFIIRKAVLEQCGNFNYSITCNEEVELFVRIKKNNYKIFRTNKLSVIHHDYKFLSVNSYVSKFKKGFYSDILKVLYIQIANRTIMSYLQFNSQKNNLIYLSLFLISLILIILGINNYIFLILYLLFLLSIFYKYKNNFHGAINLIIFYYLIIISFPKSLIRKKINYSIEIIE